MILQKQSLSYPDKNDILCCGWYSKRNYTRKSMIEHLTHMHGGRAYIFDRMRLLRPERWNAYDSRLDWRGESWLFPGQISG